MDINSLPDHCTPTAPYLARFSSAFGSCVPTSLAFLSTALGVFSIISWLFAQMPQIHKNYQLKSASGLSIYFLGEWLLGDLTNLLGALLTNQATWQVVVASYYVTVDIGLCWQYFWYTHVKTWQKTRLAEYHSETDQPDGGSGDVLVGVSPSNGSNTSGSSVEVGKDSSTSVDTPTKSQQPQSPPQYLSHSFAKEDKTPSSNRSITCIKQSSPPMPSSTTLIVVSMVCAVLTNAAPLHEQAEEVPAQASSSELAGRILSWTSTLLYLGSRLPQIYKNAIRRSTSGLSPTLFIAAFCGNFFYSASLLTNPLAWESYSSCGLHGWVGPEGSDRQTWVSLAAPFFLGAAGVLIMDATIGVQFLIYGEDVEKSVVLVKDREGRSRWRSVSGWMRGWVPSPSPNKRDEVAIDDNDDTRPLIGRRHSGQDGYGAA